MAIKSKFLNGESVGEISTWSVDEYATPVTIGNTAGGTGNVSLSTAVNTESIFSINKNITTTHDNWGSISGIVKNVSTQGITASMGHNSILGIYDVEKVIPYIYDSSVESAIAAANLAITESDVTDTTDTPVSDYYFTGTSGYFWSCAGTFTAVDSNNNFVKPSSSIYSKSGYGGTNFINTLFFNSIKVINGLMYVNNPTGDSMSTDNERLTYKTILNGENHSLHFSTGDAVTDNNNIFYEIYVDINYSAKTLNVYGNFQNSSSTLTLTPFTYSASLASIDLDNEIVISLIKRTVTNPFTVYVHSPDFSSYVSITTLTRKIENGYFKPYTITGNVRAIWRNKLLTAPVEYEHGTPPFFDPIPDNATPVPAVKMNVWEYLQAACSANGKELYINNNEIAVRDVGSNIIDITNIAVSPSLSASSVNSGNFIDIVYHNSKLVVGGELYNARNDNNKIFQVNAGQVVTTSVATNCSATFLIQPVQTDTFITQPGTYYVIAKDKLLVNSSTWSAYGGKVEVSINKENNYSIDLTITGPMTPIPGREGPYIIGISDDSNTFGALSISGIGVITDDKTLHLATGAERSKTTQEIAKTVNNPFISTEVQAYDRGVWASIDACGPKMDLSGLIPASSIDGFGLTAGSLVKYFDSIYRIVSVNINNSSASFTATRHVLVDDFDAVWGGFNAIDHDLLWGSRFAKDQMIVPLYFIGNDESLIMLLDTDTVPYYSVTGVPDISVLIDTDGVFYYVDGSGASGEVAVYLDEDNNPYA